MGKNLKGKELGKGITQRKNGVYHGRYVDRFGDRRSVYGMVLCQDLVQVKIRNFSLF